MKIRKLISIALMAATLTGAIFVTSGCKRNNKPRPGNYTIKEDDPWYLATTFDPLAMMNSGVKFSGAFSGVVSLGDYILAEESNSYYDEGDYYVQDLHLGLFRVSGVMACENDLDLNSEDYGYIDHLGAYMENDKVYLRFLAGEEYGPYYLYIAEWDIKNNTVGQPRKIDMGLGENSYINNFYDEGDRVVLNGGYSSTGEKFLIFFEKDQLMDKVDITDIGPDSFYIGMANDLGDKMVMEGISTSYTIAPDDIDLGDEYFLMTYDYNTGKLDYEKSDEYDLKKLTRGSDGRLYNVGPDGIYADGELYLSYSDCDVDMTDFISLRVMNVTEDRVVIGGYDLSSMNDVSYKVVKFDKIPQNPNAGKTVINAYSPISLSEDIMEGILNYNRGDNEYFIRYRIGEIPTGTVEETEQFYEGFAGDLLSETGPDIVFNAGIFVDLLSDDYYLDLNKEVKLDPDKYYTNISDMCKVNGKTYVIPLSFSLTGIVTERSYLKDGQNGFTFDEYNKFIEDHCDKADQLFSYLSRDIYLNLCYQNMDGLIDDKGNANFDQESFRKYLDYFGNKEGLAEYESLFLPSGDVSYSSVYSGKSGMDILYRSMYHYYGLTANKFDDPVFCGIPSFEEKGPLAFIESSVSVCSKTGVLKGCLDFIETLMKPESLIATPVFSISKDVQMIICSGKYRTELNEYHSDMSEFYSQAVKQPEGYYTVDFETQADPTKIIENLDGVTYAEPVISNIVINETVKYIKGNSTADETIAAINEQVQKYLDMK